MKKVLLTVAAALSLGASNAQLSVGSVAPDFTLTDINGVSHHLYNYLDSGYAVIIDVSAAWCAPCWSAHNSHVFENLVDHYGANGTITPGKVKVLFIEGEGTNTTAQLHGTSSGTSNATYSQGDWITGTNYPFIDNTSQNSTYLYGGFPSFTIICRDRLVSLATAGYGSAMGQESFWLNIIDAGCPTTAPSSTLDAKAVPYSGNDLFLCAANPSVKFQNYSVSQNITSATVNFYSGATVVGSAPWTGNLAPYGVATVNLPSFTPGVGQTGPYSFDVTVTGDSYAANNKQDADISINTAATSSPIPYVQNFDAATALPTKFTVDNEDGFFFFDGTGSSAIIGANGSPTKCVIVDFYGLTAGKVSELSLSNYNNLNATTSSFSFDISHAQYAATGAGSADKLEVLVSKDCGTTWASIWSKQGDALKTHAPVTSGQYVPTAATDWRHESISLNNYKSDNLFVKFKMTSNYGNLGFIDNFNFNTTASINELVSENSIKIFPNPATDMVNVSFDLVKSTNVSVQIVDLVGRVIKTISDQNMNAGTQNVSVSTANLAPGIYNVKIQTEAGSRVERLSVVK